MVKVQYSCCSLRLASERAQDADKEAGCRRRCRWWWRWCLRISAQRCPASADTTARVAHTVSMCVVYEPYDKTSSAHPMMLSWIAAFPSRPHDLTPSPIAKRKNSTFFCFEANRTCTIPNIQPHVPKVTTPTFKAELRPCRTCSCTINTRVVRPSKRTSC